MADAQRQELALVVERQLAVSERVAGLAIGEKRLRAGRHPMHRTARELGADHDRYVVRIGAGLEPEGAADILSDDVQALLRPAHDAENVVAQRAGALRAG